MKLFHITTVPQTLGFLKGQVVFMQDAGFEVHAVSSPGCGLDEFGASEHVKTHGVFMTREISPLKDVVSLASLIGLFLRYRPHIVHAHTPKAGLLGMIAAWATRVPFRIFHNHGLPHSTAKGFARTALKWSTRISCVLATRVLCVSASASELTVGEHLCPAEKISVPALGSSNGVDAAGRFRPLDNRLEVRGRMLGVDESTPVIGFAGRLVRDKGVCELYRAWLLIREKFPHTYLAIAGEPEERDGLPDEILSGLRCDPRVLMLGHVREMANFYGSIDVLVLPTYREGLPTVILESAAMQVPAVATRAVGCVDAVIDEVTGLLIDIGDDAQLAAALQRYIVDPVLRSRHGRAARERVLNDFRPQDIWAATIQHYPRADAPGRRNTARVVSCALKRAIDLLTSGAALLLLLPALLLIGLGVRLRMGSPVLFRQTRPGLHERPFHMIKFRTMRDAYDSGGKPLPDEVRLTKLGQFLRTTSLDELPELWNVLKGDMSLVGPRPLLPQYLSRYTDFQRRRHEVKPGVTGWAQVNGRNALSWEEKFEHDVWYVDNWSLLLDLKILWRTLVTTIRRDGVAASGHATMPEFFGTGRTA